MPIKEKLFLSVLQASVCLGVVFKRGRDNLWDARWELAPNLATKLWFLKAGPK